MGSGGEIGSSRSAMAFPNSGLPGDLDIVGRAVAILAREAGTVVPAVVTPLIPLTPLVPATASSPQAPADVPALGALPTTDLDRLRRQVHEVLETALAAFSPKGPPPHDRVPLLRCAAAVRAGEEASVVVRVFNEEDGPSSVHVYSTNLVADSGYDIPSARVTCSPRRVTIPPRGEASIEVKIAVPAQAPAGVYSGLIQVAAALYVKAVVSVEVK
jgi:hypothetical protein